MAFGQDSTKIQNYRISRGEYDQKGICIRLGVGIQKSIYPELGVSKLVYTGNNEGYAAFARYAAVEWIPTLLPDKPKNVYGFKIGCEANLNIIAFGIEAKFQTDTKDNDFIFTPKIGFGILSMLNLFYGYNISINMSPFGNIGHHQFSIVCNLNKRILKESKGFKRLL